MVSIVASVARAGDTAGMLGALSDRLPAGGSAQRFLYVFYGCEHDGDALHRHLSGRYPGAAILGGTSCNGVMAGGEIWGPDSAGVLSIADDAGEYGVAQEPLGDDPAAAAEAALQAALADAGCPDEVPDLIFVTQAPGREEAVIEGLRRIVGDQCPIIGGSSADNTVSGNWRQLGPQGAQRDSVVVGVLFPSGGVGFSFQGGYAPAGPSGVVTQVAYDRTGQSGTVTKSRGRQIVEIDGRPAALVYNDWIGRRLDDKLAAGGSILADTTMWPIAVEHGQVNGVPNFLLIHPEAILPGGVLSTFAEVGVGTRVYSMRGERDRLIDRAGRVVVEAASRLAGGPERLAGGLLIYCAGCMMAVGEEMTQVASQAERGFAGMPYVGCFTFGEQGCLIDRNVHGNLMISAIAFGR